jgi:hypothetical protein
MEIKIKIKKVGKNDYEEMYKVLDRFVAQNFELLWEGAVRLGLAIKQDYYAPRRVQINDTRLHERDNLKICSGYHKYRDGQQLTAEVIMSCCQDIQTLIDTAAKDIVAPFEIKIVKAR